MLVANARMYTVEATTDAAWREWVAWIARRADVPLRYEAHAAPAPLDTLWRRDDLGCVLMCGYPLATWDDPATRPHALAAVVPADAQAPGRAVYRTMIVARADSAIQSAEDLRGRRFAFTTQGSQSGYQAVRGSLADRALATGGRFFGATVGPRVSPRGIVDAVLGGDADAGPLDSYWLLLLRRHEPDIAARLRVVDCTPWTPLPPFVCSAAVPRPTRERLRAALLEAARADALVDTRAALALAGVAAADAADYAPLASAARAADAVGYPSLQ